MNIIVFGKSGFLASKLRKKFKEKKIKARFIGSEEVNLSRSQSCKKLNKIKENTTIIFFSALTPDKGKDTKTFIKNIEMINNFFQNTNVNYINHFIYISSDAVYSLKNKYISETTITNPDDLYGLMHLTREKICRNNISIDKLLILRPTIIYGKGDTHSSYGPNRFIRQINKNATISMFGKGKDLRDHLFFEDLIKIIDISVKKKIVGIFNVASGKSYQFLEVANIFKKLIKERITFQYINNNNQVSARYFDIKKLLKKFKIKMTRLEKGLKYYF